MESQGGICFPNRPHFPAKIADFGNDDPYTEKEIIQQGI
jgi:hypothetical protein